MWYRKCTKEFLKYANIVSNIYFYRVKHGAEIGSILINFELGILDEFINSLRYLKSWSEAGNKTQEERIKELQEAFNLSKKAVKYIKEN